MHKRAILCERDAPKAREGGECSTSRVLLTEEAVQAGMQIVYWLAESEVAHFTKFESLKELSIDPGADVLRDLEKGNNAES